MEDEVAILERSRAKTQAVVKHNSEQEEKEYGKEKEAYLFKLFIYKNRDNRPRKSKQRVYFIHKVLWLLW